MDYRTRIVDQEIEDQLGAAGAVLVKGPKGCGKTETARIHANSEIAIDDSPAVRIAMSADPGYLLVGDTPRLIDEWQEQPQLWNSIRHEVDRRRKKGQFILTGSSTPRDDELQGVHSGVGRFGIITMGTMSWFERGWSTGEVSLRAVIEGGDVRSQPVDTPLAVIAERLTVGGWPGNLDLDVRHSTMANANYYELLTQVDFGRTVGIGRNPETVRRVLASLARNVATGCAVTRIAADAGGADGPLDRGTVAEYLAALGRLMICDDLPAWNTHVRSAARLRKTPKRHFCDPSVACMALGLGPERLLGDLEYLGFVFESAVIHDLRVYASRLGARVSQYRDSNGREADAILEFRDGSWAAVEVKLGFGAVGQAADSLLAVAATVDQGRIGAPRALIAVTGSGFAHRRTDGVTVVPLGALRD